MTTLSDLPNLPLQTVLKSLTSQIETDSRSEISGRWETLKAIRYFGAINRQLYVFTRSEYPKSYQTYLFFKGRLSQYWHHEHRHFHSFQREIGKIPATPEFYTIPRPDKKSLYLSGVKTNHIRFSHFCLDRDWEQLKTQVFPKYFKDGNYPLLTDLILQPAPNSQTSIRLNRIRRGKVKRLTL